MDVARTLLVVDDDSNVRQLVRRVVQKDFDATLIEAKHGLAAIDILMDIAVDLVLLDVSMPVMDGLETLDALRRMPQLSELPVMILAAKAEQTQVQQLLGLGITGFLVKPFRPSLLRDRLGAVLAHVPVRPTLAARPRIGGLDMDAHSRVLLLDDNEDFRRLFVHQLSPLCEAETTGSVARALEHCAASRWDAIFVGSLQSGVHAELFARKARLVTHERNTPLVAVVGAGQQEAAAASGVYEFTVLRSFLPHVLRTGLRDVISARTLARWLLAPMASAADAFSEAAFGLVRALLPGEVVTAAEQPTWAAIQARWVRAELEVQAHGLSWRLALELPYSSALSVAESDLGYPSDQLVDSHVTAAAGRVLTRLGPELASQLEGELPLGFTQPTIALQTSAVSPLGTPRSRRWWFTWREGREGAAITLAPLAAAPAH